MAFLNSTTKYRDLHGTVYRDPHGTGTVKFGTAVYRGYREYRPSPVQSPLAHLYAGTRPLARKTVAYLYTAYVRP